MLETSKTRRLARDSFPNYLLTGRGIDIGCGKDVVSQNAEPFDRIHGDANNILCHKKAESYDFLYSSHTLEHMIEPKKCIREWFKLVKPGGHMIIIVPDSRLYEQGVFPSVFNKHHKWQFTMDNDLAGNNMIRIDDLFRELPNCRLIAKELQDFNYDYSLKSSSVTKSAIFTGKILFKLVYYLRRLGVEFSHKFLKAIAKTLHNYFGTPVDQTLLFDATAQIQIIVQKCG